MEAGVPAHDMGRWPARAAPGQEGDLIVELAVALDADGKVPALGLQQVEQRRNGCPSSEFFGELSLFSNGGSGSVSV
jgi:hypothetical protein